MRSASGLYLWKNKQPHENSILETVGPVNHGGAFRASKGRNLWFTIVWYSTILILAGQRYHTDEDELG